MQREHHRFDLASVIKPCQYRCASLDSFHTYPHIIGIYAGDVKYIWPLTQPVTDLDTQKKRMQQIRQTLGWPLIGCELIECYSD